MAQSIADINHENVACGAWLFENASVNLGGGANCSAQECLWARHWLRLLDIEARWSRSLRIFAILPPIAIGSLWGSNGSCLTVPCVLDCNIGFNSLEEH